MNIDELNSQARELIAKVIRDNDKNTAINQVLQIVDKMIEVSVSDAVRKTQERDLYIANNGHAPED